MRRLLPLLGCVGLLALPAPLLAAGRDDVFDVSPWGSVPFALLLLAIALLPLIAGRWWHHDRNKAVVAAALALPAAVYLVWLGPATDWRSTKALLHELEQYSSFIVLLGALYTVAGGLVLAGDIAARPRTNTAFLALGAVLANLIGTTGASMVLIRPLLQTNRERRHTKHLPIFFIFIVSNLGGLLTPLGDPPLFLGFLNGIDFFWTLSLWREWLLVNGIVLAVFFAWDTLAYRRETPEALAQEATRVHPLRVRGLVNVVFLAGILAAVLLQSEQVSRPLTAWLRHYFPCPDLLLEWPRGELVMLAMAALSLLVTPGSLRRANRFGWGPIREVAILFAGIFVAMVPALAWLKKNGATLGVTEAWHYFWLTGVLSSFLDNAPTYLTFATLAAGEHDLGWLVANRPLILQAISCGAVFMGANTYIGNGPNFMVKALAEEAKYPMPSFFGFLLYSVLILVPVFGLVTVLFFL